MTNVFAGEINIARLVNGVILEGNSIVFGLDSSIIKTAESFVGAPYWQLTTLLAGGTFVQVFDSMVYWT